MRLEEHLIYINDVKFGDKTKVEKNELIIDRDELTSLLAADSRFSTVKVELALPGESCRILRVADIIEPRTKVGGESQVFPGLYSPLNSVGCGQTICLKGVAVVETWQMPSQQVMFIDMSGPAASLSQFSSTRNIVLIAKPQKGTSVEQYAAALKQASLKTAVYLAKAAQEMEPDEVAIYDLALDECDQNLPRVSYICQLLSHKDMEEPLVYGHNVRRMLPTILHPNEIFDGAIVNYQYEVLANSEVTYSMQNHPVIKELYKRHGKELVFAGVIIKDAPLDLQDKRRSALIAANLAKWHLRSDGIIITKEGGGHPIVDIGLTCDRCAEMGIKSAIILTEYLSSSGSKEQTIIFNSRAAEAMISCGLQDKIELPPMNRLLGDEVDYDPFMEQQAKSTNAILDSARRGGPVSIRLIRGALSQLGETRLTTIEY